ncbi:MAG: hypothetical protein Kow0075_09360 [Salibacteraceae bacterium]
MISQATSLDQLPDTGRVWIFHSSQPLLGSLRGFIDKTIGNYLDGWQAHGASLAATYDVLYDGFIIVGVNSEVVPASGCSVDGLMRLVQQIERELELGLLDRMKVVWLEGDSIHHSSLSDFQKAVKSGTVSEDAKVFNNAITTVGAWKREWLLPYRQSWVTQYL